MVCWEFIAPLGCGNAALIFPQQGGQSLWNPLLESVTMAQLKLSRLFLFAGLGLAAGFLALAIAVALEPQLPAALIALFSPGLKLAEFVTPESGGKSFAWTFGWFLRVAIATNTAFYFMIFSLIAYVLDRRRSD
jgi:hypothetical protein